MDRLTTATLLERAEQARERGELDLALQHAGEALRIAPDDHRARNLAGLLLGQAGRTEAAVRTLHTVATMLGRRGYVLSAVAACRSALDFAPDDGKILALLGELHDRIAGKPSATRAHVPPPAMPVVADEHDLESLLSVDDPAKVLSRVEKLAGQDPNPEGPTVQPSGVPLFSEISRSAFLSLVRALRHARLPAGEKIIEEGQAGSSLFILVQGELSVLRGLGEDEKVLAKLSAGSLFGEMALITDQPRSATVLTTSAVELFEIARQHVEAVATAYPTITTELVDFAKRRLLKNLLETSPLFQPFEAPQRLEILRAFTSRVVPEGSEIIREGSPPAGLFVLAAGEVRITKRDAAGDVVEVAVLKDGDVLGEISLLEGSGLTTATATARRKTVLLHLSRERFTEIIAAHPALEQYLTTLSIDRLTENERLTGEVEDADDLVLV